MQHTPKLHIFVGEGKHFFTLRESYLHTYYVNHKPIHEVRYSHLKNLSQNWEEAVEKAKEASKNFGVELRVRESEVDQLREITRISAEEAEQRARILKEEYALAEAEALERRIRWWNQWVEETLLALNDKEGARMVGGAFHDRSLTNIPVSYLQWLIYSSGLTEIEDVQFNKMAFVAQWIRDNINVPEITESEWVGSVGDKVDLDVSIDSVRTVNGYYGVTYLYKMIDSDGNDLTWFASRDALQGKSNLKIRATIKKHDEFNGRKQTILTRVKGI